VWSKIALSRYFGHWLIQHASCITVKAMIGIEQKHLQSANCTIAEMSTESYLKDSNPDFWINPDLLPDAGLLPKCCGFIALLAKVILPSFAKK